MQEPTQQSEDANDTPNPDEKTPGHEPEDTDAGSGEGQDSTDEGAVEEQEVDPWEALEIEAAKWKDQAIRTAAELDNFRKRMSREKLDAVRYGNQSLLEELLPVLDNFDMGMQAAAQEEGSMLFMGMQMVHKQLAEFLSSQNVEEIPAEAGGEFDPKVHEALSQEASEDIEAGKIIRVVRKGYRIGERLLRPSNVIVAVDAGAAGEASADQQESK
jgi:molecular chaperone GrpE